MDSDSGSTTRQAAPKLCPPNRQQIGILGKPNHRNHQLDMWLCGFSLNVQHVVLEQSLSCLKDQFILE